MSVLSPTVRSTYEKEIYPKLCAIFNKWESFMSHMRMFDGDSEGNIKFISRLVINDEIESSDIESAGAYRIGTKRRTLGCTIRATDWSTDKILAPRERNSIHVTFYSTLPISPRSGNTMDYSDMLMYFQSLLTKCHPRNPVYGALTEYIDVIAQENEKLRT